MDTLSSALSLTTFIYDTISAVKDGPKNVKATAEKVLQFRGQLERVRQLCDKDDPSHAALLNDARQCVAEISAFAAKLQKLQVKPNERATGKMWKRLRTVLSEKDLEIISTRISQRIAQIGIHLDILTIETSMQLKAEAAVSAATLQRIEQSTVDHIDMASLHHGEVISQLTMMEALIHQTMAQVQLSVESVGAISISRAEAMHQTLAKIRQEQQRGPAASANGYDSAALGGARGDGSLNSVQASMGLGNKAHHEINQSVGESIDRLGNLIHEKESTFDTLDGDDDETCESILEDLGNVLTAAKHLARGLAEASPSLSDRQGYLAAARALNRFNRIHGSRSLTINPKDQAIYRPPRKSPSPLQIIRTQHNITLPIGFMSIDQRTTIRGCSCEDGSCENCQCDTAAGNMQSRKGLRTELLTTVSIMASRARNPVMIVAKEWSETLNTSPGFIASVSYLALNPVLPRQSKVFQVVARGDLQQLRQMLHDGEASLRDTDENGWSLLFYSGRQPSMTRFLLDSGLDIDHVGRGPDNAEQTALLRACYSYPGPHLMIQDARHANLELLLEAGADPMLHPHGELGLAVSLFTLKAVHGIEGEAVNYARIAIRNGTISAADVAGPMDEDRATLMHFACLDFGHGSKRNIAAILDLGIDINAETNDGWTCLGLFSRNLYDYSSHLYPLLAVDTITKDLDALVFLLQAGADPHHAAGESPLTIYQEAFQCLCLDTSCAIGNDIQPLGGYRGDIWDSALFLCGYDTKEFRAGYQRRPNYTSWYTREAFEMLWKGRESDCPYWDDSPWPKFGDERDDEPLCWECMDKPDKRPPYMQPWVMQEDDDDPEDEDWEDCSDDDSDGG